MKMKSSKGFTLIEVVVSLTLLLIGILALGTLFPQGMRAGQRAQDMTVTTLLYQMVSEDIKREDWSVGTPARSGVYFIEPNFRWATTAVTSLGMNRQVHVTIYKDNTLYLEQDMVWH